MEGLFEIRNITVSIRRSPEDVYAFVSNGENVPRWANGLGNEARRGGDGDWIMNGPIGKVRVRFAPQNDLGVADHDVTLENGTSVHNPIRVIPNGAGCSVIFTLLRQPGVPDDQFAEDAGTVTKDLERLKALLERP